MNTSEIILTRLHEMMGHEYTLEEYTYLINLANGDTQIMKQVKDSFMNNNMELPDLNEIDKKVKLEQKLGFHWDTVEEFVMNYTQSKGYTILSSGKWTITDDLEKRLTTTQIKEEFILLLANYPKINYSLKAFDIVMKNMRKEATKDKFPMCLLQEWLHEVNPIIRAENSLPIIARMSKWFDKQDRELEFRSYNAKRLRMDIQEGCDVGWLVNFYEKRKKKTFEYNLNY